MLLDRYETVEKKVKSVLAGQLFFVVGAPKSGTTWLQKMLDNHPEILCSGEGHFRRYIADFGQVIKNYNQNLATVNQYVYEGKPSYTNVNDELFDYLITGFIASMLGQRQEQKNARFFGDKTPLNVEYMDILQVLFPTAKFIHIVRDGRDTAISITRHSDRMLSRPPTLAGQDLFYQCIKEGAERWNGAIQAALKFKQRFPLQYHEVFYHDLKQQPFEVMAGILKFLGAETSDATLRTIIDANSFEKLSGGRKEGQEDLQSFYRKGIIGDWKNAFDAKSLEVFNQYAGESLAAMGFSDAVLETSEG